MRIGRKRGKKLTYDANCDPLEVYDRVMGSADRITADEWLEMEAWLKNWLKTDPPEEIRSRFVPIGVGETICMIASAVRKKREMV